MRGTRTELRFIGLLVGLAAALALLARPAMAREDVILIHGLNRTRASMDVLEGALTKAGYKVWNIEYGSHRAAVEELGETVVGEAVRKCEADGATNIHFVTHSLGGIMLRSYLAQHAVPSLGRVVMLAPPNQGSELVDDFRKWKLFKWVCGPAGYDLGTGDASLCQKLGPARFDLGVIAGNRSVNWINSLLIPGPDDGKVSVARTKLDGMAAHIVIPASHPFIVENRRAVDQTLEFLRTGQFADPKAKPSAASRSKLTGRVAKEIPPTLPAPPPGVRMASTP